MKKLSVGLAAPLLAGLLAACAPAAPAPTAPAAAQPTAAKPAAPAEVAPAKYTLAPDASEVRYRGRETVAGAAVMGDVVGRTKSVSGAIAFDKTGAVDSAQSKLVVDLATLKSEQKDPINGRPADDIGRLRDSFVRDRLLHADKFPNGEFVPTKAVGLDAPFPTSGKKDFQLQGNLTANGVTKPVTFDVSATFNGNDVSGTAKTKFNLGDFNIERPTLTLVLSIEEGMGVELDFKFTKAG